MEIKNPLKVWRNLDENTKILVIVEILCAFLGSLSEPTLYKALMSGISEEEIAARSLTSLGLGWLINQLWTKRVRAYLIKKFIGFAALESIMTCVFVGINLWIGWNPHVWVWGSILYMSFVCKIVGKVIKAFSNHLWQGRVREDRSNDMDYLCSYAAIVAQLIVAIEYVPSIEVSMVLWGVSALLDDISWMVIYKKDSLKDIKWEKEEGEEE